MATAVSPRKTRPALRTTPRPRRGTACPAPEAPHLSVVIVNFRQWQNTARLTRQLLNADAARRGAAEIVIVDNHSPAHPLARRMRRQPGVSLRRFDRNRGFAKGVNEGCRLSQGQWLLLLNPDMSVPPGFLDGVLSLVRRLPAEAPNIGVAGFRLHNTDGSLQGSCGPYPTFINSLAGLLVPRARRKCQPLADIERRAVDWVTGCCLLVRRDCFHQLGGLDEDFFLYYEDVDFCRRARAAGWSVVYEPELSLTHHWPLHARPVSAVLRVMTRHALLTYARKHWGRVSSGVLGGLVWLEAGIRQAAAAIRGQADSVRLFGSLRRLAADLIGGRTTQARRQLLHAARDLDTLPDLPVPERSPQPAPVGAVVSRVPA
jgi:N-acetylglucosaminyl-diphospho-decaprenol L-rhamnosyltransferase